MIDTLLSVFVYSIGTLVAVFFVILIYLIIDDIRNPGPSRKPFWRC